MMLACGQYSYSIIIFKIFSLMSTQMWLTHIARPDRILLETGLNIRIDNDAGQYSYSIFIFKIFSLMITQMWLTHIARPGNMSLDIVLI